ncbi:MAG: PepSY-associated TM helix domain-containing protein [Bacteroidota bacterium]
MPINKKRKLRFKPFIGTIHLWLGLVSGLVVFLVATSGAIMVFEKEIRFLTGTASYDRTVPFQHKAKAPPSQIFEKAIAELPEGGEYCYFYTGSKPNNVVVTWYYHPGREPEIPAGYREVLQHPYTAEVIQNTLWEGGFWGFMVKFHTTLLLPYEIGHQVVGWSTVIFLFMLLTGLILWFPKNKKGYRQRFSIKWGASKKRVTYDLHNVLGFYAMTVLLVIGLTGLVWSFETVREGIYTIASGGEEMPSPAPPTSAWTQESALQSPAELGRMIDSLASLSQAQYESVYRMTVSYPLDSVGSISVGIMTEKGKNYDRHDEFAYDRYSGALLHSEKWADQNGGERIMHLNYPIHLGLIGGWPTKILAFLASLIAASLPITGFYIWWGRRRKKKKTRKRVSKSEPAPVLPA